MEISSISGPDVVPAGFSREAPRRAEQEAPEERPEPRERPREEQRGGTIDTYA